MTPDEKEIAEREAWAVRVVFALGGTASAAAGTLSIIALRDKLVGTMDQTFALDHYVAATLEHRGYERCAEASKWQSVGTKVSYSQAWVIKGQCLERQ